MKFRHYSRCLRRWRKFHGYQGLFPLKSHNTLTDNRVSLRHTDTLTSSHACSSMRASLSFIFPRTIYEHLIFRLLDGRYLCACSSVGFTCVQNTIGHNFLASLSASPASVWLLRPTNWRIKTGRPWAGRREMGLWSLEQHSMASVSLPFDSTVLPISRWGSWFQQQMQPKNFLYASDLFTRSVSSMFFF